MADTTDDYIDDLFSAFDQEQDQNIFVNFEQDESGTENRSRIVFKFPQSDSEASDDEDNNIAKETGEPESTGSVADEKTQTTESVDAESSTTPDNNEEKKKTADVATVGDDISAPETTSYQEKFQKKKLQQFARIIDSTRCVKDEQSPGIQIVFQNNKFAKRYRSKIEQFIVNLVQHADKKDFTKTATDISTKGTDVSTCVDINDSLPVEKRNKHMWQAHGIIGSAQFHNTFMIDCKGWPHDEEDQKEFLSAEIPKYYQVFDEVYPPKENTESSDKPGKQKSSCFNCSGDHRLNDCPHPKDQNRIRAKRREHKENSTKSSNPGRYHEDPELDPKRAQFVAGTISDSLREAIGLKPDQLPPYIYRMRMFGYPPGWLKQASRSNATLAMYDRNGRETDLRGETLEDGECCESRDGVDLSKIIEYPGFTVPVPLGVNDESSTLGMPSIQQHQLKKTLMEDMVSKKAAKKRKLEEEEKEKSKKAKTESVTEEGTDDAAPVPIQTSTPAEGDKTGKEEGSKEGSPSMDSLQKEYNKLVSELGEDVQTEEAPAATAASTNGDAAEDVEMSGADTSVSESQSLREKNFSFSSCSSISKDFGTPIRVRENSFKSLPSAENFSKGVEDHIPFENLPDSVGTFEKMKNLFAVIREKVKKGKK